MFSPEKSWPIVFDSKWKKKEKLSFYHCDDISTADVSETFFLRLCCTEHEEPDKNVLDLFKEEFRCSEIEWFCIISYCCYNTVSTKANFANEGLNRQILGQRGDVPLENRRKVPDDSVKVTSTKKMFSYKRSCCCNIWAD